MNTGRCFRSVFFLTFVIGLLTFWGDVARAADPLVISNGVYIEGVSVGGMTEQEASDAVKQKVQELGEATLTLVMNGEEVAMATLNSLGLTWDNKEILNEIRNLGTTGNIVQRYKDQKDLEQQKKEYDVTFRMDLEKARRLVEGCSAYNTEPENAWIYTQDDGTPGVGGGTEGISLQVEDSVKEVQDALRGWDGGDLSISLSVEHVSPDVPYEELAQIKDVLGTATTDYSASTWERAANVENGCRKISGTLMYPGDWFSVTDAVTPFTAENGYQPAPSYEENRVVDSYGGGICQVSTTLYNAVLKSELEVTARSNHTMIVTYVDPSKDAAIAEGVMDMAFYNNLDTPIYIIGSAWGGTLNFTIYGHETRPSNRSISFESRVTSTTEPSGVKLIANPNQNVGYLNQVQSPHTGYTAELWKNIYIDGELADSVQVNNSTYQAVGTAYDVGVSTSNNALYQAMYQAIASNDIYQVQTVIANANTYTDQTETQAPETQAPVQEEAAPSDDQGYSGSDEVIITDEGGGDMYIADPPEPDGIA